MKKATTTGSEVGVNEQRLSMCFLETLAASFEYP